MRPTCIKFARILIVLLVGALGSMTPVVAQTVGEPERTRENLMVVVRETQGANRPDDSFTPTGKLTAELRDGKKVDMELAHWEFIGDTHLRFVFDSPQVMFNATPQDLESLGLKGVEDALALALANIKRAYGEPRAEPSKSGLMQIRGASPDLDSSYFLDRDLWNSLLKKHPEGIVVAVPAREFLLYASLGDQPSVDLMRRIVPDLHLASESRQISSALYLFKEGKWSVFQAPVGR